VSTFINVYLQMFLSQFKPGKVLFGRYKSVIGSNNHFCAARFKFSQSAFFQSCVNVDSVVRKYCSLMRIK